jgi:glucokinase
MSDPKALVQARLGSSTWGILSDQGYVLGIDLGAYGLRAVLLNLQTRTYTNASMSAPGASPQEVVQNAIDMAHNLLAEEHIGSERLVRIGIGFGGPVEPVEGRIRLSPRMEGWEDFLLTPIFEQTFDTVTLLDNDANLIALGEAIFGVGKEHNDLFYLHLSSGVGGGIVLNERLHHGASATAAEIGHAVVRLGWNNVDHLPTLEELVSISGILDRAAFAGFATDNLHDVFSDNPIGKHIVRETVDLLALHLAQVISLLDPEIIVLGGIVTRIGGSTFVTQIEQQIQRYFAPQFSRPVEVTASVLGVDSVAIGALALALESLRD